ncbi:unnamed protein product [Gongylonema pulchrum]|uniref:C-type lectin domain-containing protein n=1 Tax=Gongylonema pulchrum TaxID=637853 RepID=A0A183EF02_9BILA|nr:unnamed protein product [Gongylonema pulchrum]
MEASEICATLPKLDRYKHLQKNYGQLAQANDLFEWAFLTAQALENKYEELFVGVRYRKNIGFERIDKLRVRLAPWGIDEPSLQNGDCVVLKIGKDGPTWHMEDCTRRKQVVCRLTKGKWNIFAEEPMTEIPHRVRCPEGKEDWILGKTHCYYLVSNVSMISSGYKADHDCFKVNS